MAEYIFYTTEGFTQDPKGDDVENCQLLGQAFGDDMSDARCNLVKENPWIEEHGFDGGMFICRELAPCENVEKKMEFLIELLDERQLDIYNNWLNSTRHIHKKTAGDAIPPAASSA